MQILVIEDEPIIQTLIKKILKKEDHAPTVVRTLASGRELAIQNNLDAIILDLGLPDGNGFELCETLREQRITTPILVLSGERETDVKVKCLNAGADDFVTKPFDSSELIARINAITRRSTSKKDSSIIKSGELTINKVNRNFTVNNNSVSLTNNEMDLLAYMMEREDKVISRYKLAEDLWGIDFHTESNFINVYISYIRKKIRSHSDYKYISTIRNEGFVFKNPT